MTDKQEKRVQCPACKSVAFVRLNKGGDEYLTCGTCGPWNGKGSKFRTFCRELPEVGAPSPPKKVDQIAQESLPTKTVENPDSQSNWLNW